MTVTSTGENREPGTMIEQRDKRDLPSVGQLEAEAKRLRSRQGFIRTMLDTIGSLIVVAAIAVIVSTMLMPVMRVTGA